MTARLAPRALADLEAIRTYLVPISPAGAEQVRVAIADTIALLAQFPHCGRDTDIEDVRVLPVVRYPYLVYHLAIDDDVLILHIRHAARAAPGPADLRP